MDYRVTWSPDAYDDVESIAQYIARDSAFYAKAVVTNIINQSRALKKFPERGRIVPEIEDESIREVFIYNYRLIYRIQEKVVLIAAIVHGSRLLDPLMTRFTETP